MPQFFKTILLTCIYLQVVIATVTLSGQSTQQLSLADAQFKSGDYTAAKSLYRELVAKELSSDTLYPLAVLGLAESHFQLREYDSALVHYEVLNTIGGIATLELKKRWLVQTRLGFTYRYIKRELKQALATFEKERGLIEQLDTALNVNNRFANAYNLSTTYRLLENYEKALDFGFSALAIVQSMETSSERNLILSYSVIANILGDMRDFKRATEYHLKKIVLGESLYGVNKPQLADYYNNAAVDFYSADDLVEAQKYFLKAQRALGNDRSNRRLLSSSHRGLGAIYRRNQQVKAARLHLDSALIYSEGNAFQMASSNQFLAQYYAQIQEFDSALQVSQQALTHAIPTFKWTNIEDNPSDEELLEDPFHYRLLNQKASSWLLKYKEEQDQDALEQAHICYQTIDRLTETYRDNFTLESSKLFFQDWNYSNYERAIETLYLLYENTQDERYISEAWLLVEKNKSLVLLENLIDAEKRTLGGLTDSLKTAIASASQKRWNVRRDLNNCKQNGTCDEQDMITLRASLSLAEERISGLEKSVQESMPNYYRAAFEEVVVTLNEAAEKLDDHAIMANYFATDSDYFVITASGKQKTFSRIVRSTSLDEQLQYFLEEVSGETMANQDLSVSYSKYTKAAKALYDQLVTPIIDLEDTEELIVIPDGILSLVPFEALISKMPDQAQIDFINLAYLLKKYAINYSYSATLWFRNADRKGLSTNAKLMAFATAETKGRPELAKLIGTKAESDLLSKLSNATVFSDSEASESNFKENCMNAEILHLALHNINDKANPLNSQIIFNGTSATEDGNLHMFELYGLQMQPELVVLSACETGAGDWKRGEGPYHMGRGFLYHGNPALVVSLWKVRDNFAAKIMNQLYTVLNNGENSGSALRSAKLNYLQQADELTAHPSNWAAFVSIGQVSVESSVWKWPYFGFIIGLLFVIAARKRLKSRRT